jgi:hypothetical protein
MDVQAPTGRMAQRPQALGRRVARPVDGDGILSRQHHGGLAQAAGSRLEMTGQNVLRRDGVVCQEARGGCEHRVIAIGFGEGGCGVLGQRRGPFDHPLRASRIAQLDIGTFVDGPVGGIGLATHARLLCQRVTLEATLVVHVSSIPQEPLK